MNKPILLVAGGSGGHMFPAIAVAQRAHHEGQACVLFTDPRGLRFLSDQDAGLFSRVVVFDTLSPMNGLGLLIKTVKQIRSLRPKVAVGFGGKMSFLPLIMARLLGIKCAIHQSDAVLGQANRWMIPWMHTAFSAYPHLPFKTQVIGTPVRKAYHAILPAETTLPFEILILGGSQGAHFWSQLMPQALGLMPTELQQKLAVTHQVPEKDLGAVQAAYGPLCCAKVTLFSFSKDLHENMQQAHLVFSRAGASTLAELAVAGRAVFLVPYPFAKNDHQKANAQWVVNNQAGWVHDQKELTPELISEFLSSCLHNPEQVLYAGKKMKEMSSQNATDLLYKFCHTS